MKFPPLKKEKFLLQNTADNSVKETRHFFLNKEKKKRQHLRLECCHYYKWLPAEDGRGFPKQKSMGIRV